MSEIPKPTGDMMADVGLAIYHGSGRPVPEESGSGEPIRCAAKRSHGVCGASIHPEDETCPACGADRPLASASGGAARDGTGSDWIAVAFDSIRAAMRAVGTDEMKLEHAVELVSQIEDRLSAALPDEERARDGEDEDDAKEAWLRERLIAYERTIAGRGGLTKDKIKEPRREALLDDILGKVGEMDDNHVAQILCRAFDAETYELLWDEWLDWYKPEQWLTRRDKAFGAFLSSVLERRGARLSGEPTSAALPDEERARDSQRPTIGVLDVEHVVAALQSAAAALRTRADAENWREPGNPQYENAAIVESLIPLVRAARLSGEPT